MNKALINCDLGECLSPDPDAEVMPLIDMANIACGGHVGDKQSMSKTLRLALKHQVGVGVHPSYKDRENFGRVTQALSLVELYDLLYQQIKDFQQLCEPLGAQLSYVKPHGALYHDMTQNQQVLEVICQVIQDIDSRLSLVVQAGNEAHFSGVEKVSGLVFLREAFADRAYQEWQMLPRSVPGSVLDNPEKIISQFGQFSNNKQTPIDTICFHSDNPASVEALKQLKHV